MFNLESINCCPFHNISLLFSGVVIDMTAPVVDKLLPKIQNPTPFTQSFYIPYIWQGTAPAPTGEGVYLQEFPAINVYVR